MTWKYIAWDLLTFPECNTMDAWAIDGMGWHFVLKHSICYASLSVLFGISNDVITHGRRRRKNFYQNISVLFLLIT